MPDLPALAGTSGPPRGSGLAGQARPRRRERGVVTVEFALLLMLGVVPLLMLTFSGMMIFIARQSLEMAAAEGARASLRYGDWAAREGVATEAAGRAMQWLVEFAGDAAAVEATRHACSADASSTCITVTARYDYGTRPFFPGTAALYNWTMDGPITSSATVQLDTASAGQLGP